MSQLCPVCGTSSHFECRTQDADIYRCPECDHCFSDPNSLKSFEDYGTEYYEETHQNWFKKPNIALFKAISKAIAYHKQDATVLDVGCGRGDLLKYLRRENPSLSLTGIDLISNEPVDGIEFLQTDILTTDMHQRYDVVMSFLAIEHVVDIQKFVSRLREMCVTDGIIILTTLNDRSVLYESAKMLRRLGYKAAHDRLYSQHHLNHFNVSSLKRLMKANGCSIVKTIFHNIPLAAVDFPSPSPALRMLLLCGVWATFAFGTLIRRTYLQTVICKQ
ncbi:MAG: class I SAM-dependent methyltransferase [Armatimonadota bacterium]|nr:class I SAM-dependent methyltransferase [Armatimonadota bacterium]